MMDYDMIDRLQERLMTKFGNITLDFGTQNINERQEENVRL